MIGDKQLSPFFQVADQKAIDAQKFFLWATRIRLLALVAASVFGLFAVLESGSAPSPAVWPAIAATIAFFIAIVVELILLIARPERVWYEARAAAESVKTLCWRYMVGGTPFAIDTNQAGDEFDDLFLDRIKEVLAVLKQIVLKPLKSATAAITKEMKDVRKSSPEKRKQVYKEDRVQDQHDYYTRKTDYNKRYVLLWTIALYAAETAGLVSGFLYATGKLQIDLLAVFAAIAAAVIAWIQTKQFSSLAAAYSVTALELSMVLTKLDRERTEEEWAEFVNDAEEAFSREHTMWKASRGVQ